MDRTDRPDAADVLTRTLLTVEAYRAELLNQAPKLAAPETVSLTEAVGRRLAAPVRAAIDVPHFRNSSMDGFAVCFADLAKLPARLRVRENVPAGALDFGSFEAGECARVMTGGGVPDCADTIVPLEMTRPQQDGWVSVVERPQEAGAFVRGVGSAMAAGTQLADAGTVVTPGLVAALTAAGVARVEVARIPRVAIVSTGAELVSPGVPAAPGQVPDVNTHVLGALAQAAGGHVTLTDPLPDDVDAFTRAITLLAATHDVVVVSGGASVGDHDVARIVLGSQPESAFRHVRMQPGKPQGWAKLHGALVVSLPGNPLSATASFLNFVGPMLTSMAGGPSEPELVRCVAGSGWSSPAGRRQFVPVRVVVDESARVVASPVHAHGSASHLTTVLADADGFAVVPEDVTSVASGDVLEMMRLPSWVK